MQMLKTLGLVFAIVSAGLAQGRGQESYPPAFEKLKTLVGEWEGKLPDGKTARVNYRLTAVGSALVETLMPGDPKEMVTVYHPDGESVMLTHYCAARNQPRMRAKPQAGEIKELAFGFVDVTNLASPGAGHMRDLVITFLDEDHFTARWTYRKEGKDEPEVFSYTRKK
jgi:hypothetical protein